MTPMHQGQAIGRVRAPQLEGNRPSRGSAQREDRGTLRRKTPRSGAYRFPNGFIKGELALRLTAGARRRLSFSVSGHAILCDPRLRQRPARGYRRDSGRLQPCPVQAPARRRVLGIDALPRERSLRLRFASPQGDSRFSSASSPRLPKPVLTLDGPGPELAVLARSQHRAARRRSSCLMA